MKAVKAKWTGDCNGKQSFDGPILSLDTRFWPGASSGHGSLTTHLEEGSLTFGIAPYGDLPSARASIDIQVGEEDYVTWKEQEFEAETEEEVKRLVEAWAEERHAEIAEMLGLTGKVAEKASA